MPIQRLFSALSVFLLLVVFTSTVHASESTQQVADLVQHIDKAVVQLDAGNIAGVRAEYQAFDDGWLDIEDGVRAASRDSYRAIEGAMRDVKRALAPEPVDAAAVKGALQALDEQCDDYIATARLSEPQPLSSTNPQVSFSTVMGELDLGMAAIDSSDPARANKEMDDFRRDWTDVEAMVKAKSPQVYTDTENNLAKASTLLTIQPPDMVQARAIMLRMKSDLAPFAAGTQYGIFDAAIILFREGLEALLVVGATLAFLQKTGNGDKARWIWAGSGLGVLASLVIALIINIAFAQASVGQNREVLEGATGLIAAAMFIYVSFWMHSKANLAAWHRYVGLKTMTALARKSLVSMGLISFLAVFREGSETALFYLGIAPSISFGDLVTGLAAGAIGLAVIGVVMFVFGVNLPIRPFFLVASALVYYLAFKFVGTGIHSLQVGGVLRSHSADYLPSNDFLGLYPTWETALAQLALVLLAAAVPVFYYVRGLLRKSQPETASAGS